MNFIFASFLFSTVGDFLWFDVYGFSMNSIDEPAKIISGPENETIDTIKSHKHI